MAASQRRDLFISVNGSIDNLSSAMKAGRSVLLDFNAAAGSIVDQVNAKLRDMGSGSAAGANEAVKNYESAFARIKQAMAASANDPGASLKIFDINSLNAQIAKAEQAAATNRMVAETAQQVAAAGGPSAAIQLQLAAAYGTAAAKGEQEVVALRQQAIALAEVRGALGTDVVAMDNVTHGAGRMSIAKMEMMHVVRASSDAFAAGAPLAQIFSMELGRMAEAAAMSGGGMGKLGAVLSGPMGLALTAGLAILAPFVAKLFESADAADAAVDKLKKEAVQTEITARAHDAFRQSIEGVTAAIDEAKRANDKWLEGEGSAARTAAVNAQARLLEAEAIRKSTIAKLENARADVQILMQAQGGGGQRGDMVSPGLASSLSDIAKFDAQIAALDGGMDDLRARVTQTLADVANEEAKKAADPIERIKRLYEGNGGLIDQKRRELVAAKATTDEMGKQLGILQAQERAAVKAEEKRQSDARKTTPTGTPSSALLATAEGFRGAGEGSSSLRDLFSKAGISIDPKITAWCAAFVNAVLATDGLKGTGSLSAKSFLDYGTATNAPQKGDIVVAGRKGGGHVGFFEGFDKDGNVKVLGGNTGNKVGVETVARADVLGYRRAPASGQAEATAAETAADKEARRRASYEQQAASAEAEYMRAMLDLTGTVEDRLDVALATIEAARISRDAALNQAVTDKKLTRPEADYLIAVTDRTADAKSSVATNRAITKTLDETLRVTRDELRDKLTILDLQGDLATTAKMRKRIALQILDLEEQERRAVANRLLASHDPKDQVEGQRQLDQIDREAPLRRAQIDKRNAGPLDDYRNKLHAATDDMDEALQGVAAHGLQNLEDGLLGIIDGTESVGSAFKKMAASIIADLARIAIEKAIVAGLELITGASGGHIGGTGGTAVHPFATGMIPGFAGGTITGPGTGTSDSILAFYGKQPIRVSNGESIMTAAATRRFGAVLKAMNDNRIPGFAGGGVPSWPSLPAADQMRSQANAPIVIHLATRKGEAFETEVLSVSGPHTVEILRAAAPSIVEAASDHTIARVNRARL